MSLFSNDDFEKCPPISLEWAPDWYNDDGLMERSLIWFEYFVPTVAIKSVAPSDYKKVSYWRRSCLCIWLMPTMTMMSMSECVTRYCVWKENGKSSWEEISVWETHCGVLGYCGVKRVCFDIELSSISFRSQVVIYHIVKLRREVPM